MCLSLSPLDSHNDGEIIMHMNFNCQKVADLESKVFTCLEEVAKLNVALIPLASQFDEEKTPLSVHHSRAFLDNMWYVRPKELSLGVTFLKHPSNLEMFRLSVPISKLLMSF